MKKAFSVLQRIGKSLMLPVSVLPAAGILLRFGQQDLLNMPYIAKAGDVIFFNLPMIFAVGVAIGFADGEGTAALAAVLGELILEGIFKVAGIDNMGVLGGIIIGIMSAVLYNKYHRIRPPQILGFFGGKRFIPIITAVLSTIFAIIMVSIWPTVEGFINILARMASTSVLGPAFYAAGKRLLIPLGLHHMYYPAFLFQFGSFKAADGITYLGDSARYFHGDPTAGIFMASEYPVLMFGIPGAALAMIAAAKKENRKKVAGIMISAALVSFVTGITEPIEFSFIFAAPLLFVFHVLAAFFSGIITSIFSIRLGYTFSASAIDYVLGYKFASHPLFLWPIGLMYFIIYFGVFYGYIKGFNIKTPGRGQDEEEVVNYEFKDEGLERAYRILEAIGGKENVEEVDACITRLRFTVKNINKLSKSKIKNTGSAGILEAENSIQLIYGTEAERIKDDIKYLLTSKISSDQDNFTKVENINNELKNKDVLDIANPIKGTIVSVETVPDEVFSSRLLGDGFAVSPEDNKVYSPVEGIIEVMFPTKHALAIKTEEGIEILIHVGVDTVRLNGEGFNTFVKKGDKVKRGDMLMEFDKHILNNKAKSMLCPIIITNMKKIKYINVDYGLVDKGHIVAKVELK